jgi:glutathione synthase/RimK-type ligase-like ATP-grasp enzyme
MVLIITQSNDPHTDQVIKRLQQAGIPSVRFEPDKFPTQSVITMTFGNGKSSKVLHTSRVEDAIDLDDVKSVWKRRMRSVNPSNALSEIDAAFSRRESEHIVRGLWHLLKDRFWVNPFENDLAAHSKPYQLEIASQLGMTIPATLVTNDPDQIEDFFERCSGKMIYKPFQFHSIHLEGVTHIVYTSMVSRQDMLDFRSSIELAPNLFQEYIPKHSELRVTMFGHDIVAVEIDSQATSTTQIDWRRYAEGTPHRPYQLPSYVEDQLREYMDRLGLVFGCIDMILTPDGRYVFLEVNPSGQWYWLEEILDIPLADKFTKLLTSPMNR